MKRKIGKKNNQFIDSMVINDLTYQDYLERFKQVVLSMFEWVNLPETMNAQYLERCLYYEGMATFLKSKSYGFINTKCADSGKVNIYGLPTQLNCYSYDFQEMRNLYTGLVNENSEYNNCILVQNNWDRIPTAQTMELFALRLYEAERTCDVNIKAQKTPVLLLVDEKQRLMLENMYNQYDGNQPFIFGDKNQLTGDSPIQSINTGAPFVADKIMTYKKQIWNEALTFLGINNIMEEKKERLVTGEVDSNNELINLNLQARLAPRKQACKEFNELFGLKGEKAIDVRVRSDLFNIIKQAESVVTDYKEMQEIENIEIDKKEA